MCLCLCVWSCVRVWSCVCACAKDYVYVYDGVPLYPGFSSDGAKLLATLCGSNVDDELTVTSHSGVMTVFFEAVINPSSTVLSSHCKLTLISLQTAFSCVVFRVQYSRLIANCFQFCCVSWYFMRTLSFCRCYFCTRVAQFYYLCQANEVNGRDTVYIFGL